MTRRAGICHSIAKDAQPSRPRYGEHEAANRTSFFELGELTGAKNHLAQVTSIYVTTDSRS